MEHFMDSVETVETDYSDFEQSPEVAADFVERVRLNQQKLRAELKPHYDFIVCGSGSSGSVVARRLAENPDVSVLLLEAGGDDDVPEVMEPDQWSMNLGSERDWNFQAQPNPHLNGRAIPMDMGKVLGGGSSINVMAWSRGHKNDWDFFAAEAGDREWSYESVLKIYRRIEDWHGAPDPKYRGTQGNGTVVEQRLYQLIRQPKPISDRQFESKFSIRAWRLLRSHSADPRRRLFTRLPRPRVNLDLASIKWGTRNRRIVVDADF
jgi:GMC oxidoreductase